MPARTCDLPTLVDILHSRATADGVAVAIAGDPFARTERLARLLVERLPSSRIHPPESFHDDSFAGVRVWLDDAEGVDAHLTAARSRGEPPGRWVYELDPASQARADAQGCAEEESRRRADVIFAALRGFPGLVHLRFFYDYSDSPLWPQADVADPLEDLLPITVELRDRLRSWVVSMHAAPRAQPGLEAQGRLLAEELQEQVGAGYRIEHRS